MPYSLFDLISLLYLFRTAGVAWQLARQWRAFWDAEVTLQDRQLARQVAFFLLIPFGVFLHEVGHALATWQVGGEVVEFQWRVFWGYIIPAGNFTPLEDWWISLSGNLVSIALGLLPLALLLLVRPGIWAELLYAFSRQQLYFALVAYPVLGLFGFGDWLAIYDFSLGPIAYAALGIHVALVLGLLALDRSGWAARRRLAQTPEAWAAMQQHEAEARAQPGSVQTLVKLARHLHQQGETAQATHYLKQAERLNPGDPELQLTWAQLAFDQRNYHRAAKAAQAALQAGLPAESQGAAHTLLAFAHLELGRRGEALTHFDAALRLQPQADHLYYWRAIVKRSLGRGQEARTDFEQAARLASNEHSRARALQEIETIGPV